ncbi:MAG: hypothetical protein AABY22_05630 [Nanoarchaeota archaeon]
MTKYKFINKLKPVNCKIHKTKKEWGLTSCPFCYYGGDKNG